MNPNEKIRYFINYAKCNSVLIHRSMEDSALSPHLRCPLCWVTIPRTEQPGRCTVDLRVLGSELPWMVSTKRSKNRQGMPWTTGSLASHLSPFLFACRKCPLWAHFEHLVLSWWHCFEKLWILWEVEPHGRRAWGHLRTAQPHSLSILFLFWHVKWGVLVICSSRHGCHNLPSMIGCDESK